MYNHHGEITVENIIRVLETNKVSLVFYSRDKCVFYKLLQNNNVAKYTSYGKPSASLLIRNFIILINVVLKLKITLQ